MEQQPQDILNICMDCGLLYTHWKSSDHNTCFSKAAHLDDSRVGMKQMRIQRAALCGAKAR